MIQRRTLVLLVVLMRASAVWSAPVESATTSDQLKDLDSTVVEDPEAAKLRKMVPDQIEARFQDAIQRENDAWSKVTSKETWEAFRKPRIDALRESLSLPAAVPADLHVRSTRTIKGDGYRIENLVYETRPGLLVSANLYLPDPVRQAGTMAGVLISHAHHAPKTQGELQDMGITWAKLGCAVLVPDHIGHGERRQHPFAKASDYPKPFKVDRQDYRFRYTEAMELHLAGESLIGWMVWDLMRGVDVLLAQPGIDKSRILLIGAVAGGGDPAAVTAALDERIAAVAPFNFGGPQPDYAIPENAEQNFEYFGWPWWETTRCLRNGARDGFAQWLIVASVAPRGLIYSYEFAMDLPRDPVWPRLQKVYGFYGAADHLALAAGHGNLKGQPPEATHATNIGPVHRATMYPTLKKWLNIEPPEKESRDRHSADELACFTGDVKSKPLFEVAGELAKQRNGAARAERAKLTPDERRRSLCTAWAKLLGDIEPREAKTDGKEIAEFKGLKVERIPLTVEPGIIVPTLLLIPTGDGVKVREVVVAVAQEGKKRILRERASTISELLRRRAAVCLVDVRGTGETQFDDDDRGRAAAADMAQSELMLGQTLLGARLRDLRSVLRYLRQRDDLKDLPTALWGDSFAAANPPERNLEVPSDAEDVPVSEPLGELLALFGALYEPHVGAVYTHGGLANFQACLRSPFCYVPPDVIVPGSAMAGDIADVAAAIAPRPLWMTGLVDGLNRSMSDAAIKQEMNSAIDAYGAVDAGLPSFSESPPSSGALLGCWFTNVLLSHAEE